MKNLLKEIIISSLIVICISRECSDGSECPGNKTCCAFEFGTGCCPYENGICCSDLKHCCPNNMTCSDNGSCIPSSCSFFDDNLKDKLEFVSSIKKKLNKKIFKYYFNIFYLKHFIISSLPFLVPS